MYPHREPSRSADNGIPFKVFPFTPADTCVFSQKTLGRENVFSQQATLFRIRIVFIPYIELFNIEHALPHTHTHTTPTTHTHTHHPTQNTHTPLLTHKRGSNGCVGGFNPKDKMGSDRRTIHLDHRHVVGFDLCCMLTNGLLARE